MKVIHMHYLQRSWLLSWLLGAHGIDVRYRLCNIPVLCFCRSFVINDPDKRVPIIVDPTWRQSNWAGGGTGRPQLFLSNGPVCILIEDGCFHGRRQCCRPAAWLAALPDDHDYQHSDNGQTSANSRHCTGEWKEVRVTCNRKKYMQGILSCSASKPQKFTIARTNKSHQGKQIDDIRWKKTTPRVRQISTALQLKRSFKTLCSHLKTTLGQLRTRLMPCVAHLCQNTPKTPFLIWQLDNSCHGQHCAMIITDHVCIGTNKRRHKRPTTAPDSAWSYALSQVDLRCCTAE